MKPDRLKVAWLLLCGAFALHIADEAACGFLDVYNPTVHAIRETSPWLPLPTFTFPVWLTGLIVLDALLMALTPLASPARGWWRRLAYAFSGIMILNGVGHTAGSVYLGSLMPGVYSSPFILAAAVCLLFILRRSSG